MLVRTKYDVNLAPVKISWTSELVDDEEAGDFYMELRPHVEYGEKVTEPTAQFKAVVARQRMAEQGRRIAKQINEEILRDTNRRLRAEYNKRRGQRWNKKV